MLFGVQWKELFNLNTQGPTPAAFAVHAVVPALPGPDPLSPSTSIFYSDDQSF